MLLNKPERIFRRWEEANVNNEPTGRELVRKLNIGSRAIDQMRHEIHSTVSMVLGLLSKEDIINWEKTARHYFAPHDKRSEIFESPEYENGCSWELIQFFGTGHRLIVICTLLDVIGDTARYNNVYRSNTPTIEVPTVYTKRARIILPLFLEGMLKTFPALKDKLRPFLDAADYFDNQPAKTKMPSDDRKSQELMEIAQKLHAEWRTQLNSRSHDDIASELFSEVRRILHPANKD